MVNQINNLTSNQYYGGINRRYDKRINILIKAGFVHDRQTNFWCHKTNVRLKNCGRIHNSEVMHCDKRHFDMLIEKYGR